MITASITGVLHDRGGLHMGTWVRSNVADSNIRGDRLAACTWRTCSGLCFISV